MTKEEVISLGTKLGLKFNEKNNYKDALKKGRVVFDGCNGQRFLVESSWKEKEIYKTIGDFLILQGKRMKCMEISNVLSTVSD